MGVRLGDAERQRLVDALRQHLVDGRLDLEEYERRLAVVYAATHQEQADEAFADLPLLAPPRRSRSRRHGERQTPEPHWRPTAERFRDPTSGQVTRVWVDPLDGTRHYVPEATDPNRR